MPLRCEWSGADPLYIEYHDTEWGVPLRDDRKLFEFLILEGFQAGLSWLTILKKRKNCREAFDDFDPVKISRYGPDKIAELLSNQGIIRNKLKTEATVQNAMAFLAVQKEFGSFSAYIWKFVGGNPLKNSWKSMEEMPAVTEVSFDMSRDLKARKFKFVGPTICYAFMQAVGLVNDHIIECFRYDEV